MPRGHSVDLSMTQEGLDMGGGIPPLFSREGLSTDRRTLTSSPLYLSSVAFTAENGSVPDKGPCDTTHYLRRISSENNLSRPFKLYGELRNTLSKALSLVKGSVIL